jgi:hypothetical protein
MCMLHWLLISPIEARVESYNIQCPSSLRWHRIDKLDGYNRLIIHSDYKEVIDIMHDNGFSC